MAEHAAHFLSLYRDEVDSALAVQALDSWDSFPLFQLLNNFLRTDRESSAPWLLLLLTRRTAELKYSDRKRLAAVACAAS